MLKQSKLLSWALFWLPCSGCIICKLLRYPIIIHQCLLKLAGVDFVISIQKTCNKMWNWKRRLFLYAWIMVFTGIACFIVSNINAIISISVIGLPCIYSLFSLSSEILPMTSLLNNSSIISCVPGHRNVLQQQFLLWNNHLEWDILTNIWLSYSSSFLSSKLSTLLTGGQFEKHSNQKHVHFHCS